MAKTTVNLFSRENRKVVKKVYKKDRQQVHNMLKYMYDAATGKEALKAAEDTMGFLEGLG